MLSKQIKQIRMSRDLTLADVATLARVSIATVHRAEHDRVLNARIQHRLERFVEKMEVASRGRKTQD